VEVEDGVDMGKLVPGVRVALRSDSYALHRILPTKVDPLVSLMKVEKVPDASYDMVGGLDKQITEIKEVIELPIKHPELFDALGVAQPKVGARRCPGGSVGRGGVGNRGSLARAHTPVPLLAPRRAC
jgi:ATP-dependent 26S proteasome regulatory subunit